MADELERVAALVRAQASARNALTKKAVKAARVRTGQMTRDAYHSKTLISRYAKDVARLSQAYARQAASVENAYQARLLAILTEAPVAPVKQVDVTRLRGIPHESVYGRVADFYRWLIDEDHTDTQARHLAIQRAGEITEIDILLAVRDQAHQFVSSKKQIKYWRRVIHPEKSATGVSCGLCIAISDRVYSRVNKLEIHANCNCAVVPVVDKTRDYGARLNQDDLNEIYEQAGGTAAKKLKETRYTIRQHGELGSVLTYAGNRFRGPAQVRADTGGDKPVPAKK